MKSAAMALLKAGVTAALFFLLFRKVDFQEFADTLRHANVGIEVGAFLIFWIGHYICIYRWRMLMRPLMPILSIPHLFGIYCIGLFFNLTFPTVVGGDVVKMYYAGKPSKKFAQSFAATFLDRDAGMFAMMIIACIASLVHPVSIPKIPVKLIIWGAFFAFLAANIAIFTPSLHNRLTGVLHRLKMVRLAHKIDAILSAFQVMGTHKIVLVNSLLISLVNQLFAISVTWIMAVGLHIEISLVQFMVFVPVITLISMIPLSLNGMGLREYAYVSLLTGIGVDREAAMALGLLSSAVVILSAIPGGFVYIFFRNRSDARQMAEIETDF
jgi:glycosyltransferase 2 family protein